MKYITITLLFLNTSCLVEIPKRTTSEVELEKENKELRQQISEIQKTVQWVFLKAQETRGL